jgi:alkylhydroperoxidase family enzyme
MNGPPSAGRLPTLTEVVGDAGAPPVQAAAPLPSEHELVQRVLGNVQRQIDLMLEQRLREALAPALARLTDALLREVRGELTPVLRDVVARAVAQELSRHRDR